MRLTGFTLLLLLFAMSGFSQAGDIIKGKVTDEEGKPIAGVSVTVKEKPGSGTTTNSNGEFSLSAATWDILVFTHISFETKEQAVVGSTILAVTMTSKSNILADVIVNSGYGITKLKDATGSVNVIGVKDFQKGQLTTPEQLIAGKVPGVSVISNSGQPGSGSTIRIRAGSSLRASNDPLIVIDGVPLDNNKIEGAGNPLSFINPNDIESFTILKDASAAAIYGTRGSNGVILITTKKGSAGKLKVNFTTTNSISAITKKVDVLTGDQMRAIVNEKGNTSQIAMLGTANTDWQDEIYQAALATDNTISVTGGIRKLPYRFSAGYTNQNGILRTDNLQRISTSLMLSPSFFDNHLKLSLSFKGTMQRTRFANTAAIGGAVCFDPTQPVYATKNTERFGGYWEWLDPSTSTGLVNLVPRNPVGLLEQYFSKSTPARGIGNIQLEYKFHFLPELRANVNLGYDLSEGDGTIYVSDSAASDYIAGGIGGQNNKYKGTKKNTVFDFYLNYTNDFKKIKSHFDLTAGYSYNDFLTTNYYYAKYNAQGNKYPNSDPAFPYNKPENRLVSFFGRLNYTFNDRYLLTATLRRDGSSRFSSDNRWGMFPSFALAWKLSEESFIQSAKSISMLKLRLGYGITGQQDGINDYDYLSFYGLSSSNATYQFGNSYYQMYRPGGYNPNLKWEQTATTNIGLDYGFLNNRISGSIDFYYKETSDLLNLIPQPAGTNFSAFFIANVGSMYNKGVEFSLNAQPVSNRNFTWDAGFNITYNKNRITNLTVVPDDATYKGIQTGNISGGVGGGFAQINAVGYSTSTFNLYKQVYDANGNPLENVFVDVNEDGIINEEDLSKSKSAVPDWFMGFSTNLNYKRWSAGFVLRSSIGNYVYNNVYSSGGSLIRILGGYVLCNASTNYLETGFNGSSSDLLSDYYIQNASFLRMDNLTLGYDAGKLFNNSASLRITGGIQNVFVITKYKGIDPEISNGIDNDFYPRPRTYSLGLSLDF